MSLLSKLFAFVILTIKQYSIDESHGIKHSMDVLNFASNIYNNEINNYSTLKKYENVIYIAAILHDMCDKKYMDENEGIKNIEEFLKLKINSNDINIVKNIVTTMSYSKVKKVGFPKFEEYQMAYHVVREADLLSAYDFDRCMIYNLNKSDGDIVSAYNDAEKLFNTRVLRHFDDDLFITSYSKIEGLKLHSNALNRMNTWQKILKNPLLI
jgi:HD superfamily phosphodiesterase